MVILGFTVVLVLVINKQYSEVPATVKADVEQVKVRGNTNKIKPLSIEGSRIIDSEGKDLVLKGVTTDEFRFHPDHPDVDLLKQHLLEVNSWGINLVVLYLQQPLKVNKRVDEIVELADWATENKIYTLVFPVVHEDDDIPAKDRGLKKSDVTYTAVGKNTEMILDTLSKKLSGNVGVMYGMGAEHHNVPQDNLYKRQLEMIDTVRKNSPESIVVINGMEYGHYLEMYIANPPPQMNVLYDIHQYVASSAKGIDITKCKMPRAYLGKLPLILGEFGGAYSEDFGSFKDLECISNFIYNAKNIKIGFVVHTIDQTSRMGLFAMDGQVTSKGKLLKNALADMKIEGNN